MNPEQFGGDVLAAAQSSLLWIGGGVAAALVVWVVVVGIVAGLSALRDVASDRQYVADGRSDVERWTDELAPEQIGSYEEWRAANPDVQIHDS